MAKKIIHVVVDAASDRGTDALSYEAYDATYAASEELLNNPVGRDIIQAINDGRVEMLPHNPSLTGHRRYARAQRTKRRQCYRLSSNG